LAMISNCKKQAYLTTSKQTADNRYYSQKANNRLINPKSKGKKNLAACQERAIKALARLSRRP